MRHLRTLIFTALALIALSAPALAGRVYIPAEAGIYPSTGFCASNKVETQASNSSGVVYMTAACDEDTAVYFKVAYPSDAPVSGTPFTADINWTKFGDGDTNSVCWALGSVALGAGDDVDTVLAGGWQVVSVSDAGLGDTIRNTATTPAFLPAGAEVDATLHLRLKRDTGACTDTEGAGVLAHVIDLTLKY